MSGRAPKVVIQGLRPPQALKSELTHDTLKGWGHVTHSLPTTQNGHLLCFSSSHASLQKLSCTCLAARPSGDTCSVAEPASPPRLLIPILPQAGDRAWPFRVVQTWTEPGLGLLKA